jgi:hypothetical protein
VTVSPATRAVFEAEEFDGNTPVRVVGTKDGTDGGSYAYPYYCDGTMKFKKDDLVGFDGTVYGSGGKYYPETGTIYLSGFYPITENNWSCADATACNATVSGYADLMYAPSVSNTLGATNTPLQFGHLLTLLEIKAFKSVNVDFILKEITLTRAGAADGYLNTTCNVNLNGGTVSFSGGTENTSIPCCSLNSESPLSDEVISSTDPTGIAYVLAPPLKKDDNELSTAADYTLKVIYKIGDAGADIEKSVPLNLQAKSGEVWVDFDDDTAGKSFAIELNFKGSEIKATAAITKWDPAGKAEGTID